MTACNHTLLPGSRVPATTRHQGLGFREAVHHQIESIDDCLQPHAATATHVVSQSNYIPLQISDIPCYGRLMPQLYPATSTCPPNYTLLQPSGPHSYTLLQYNQPSPQTASSSGG